MIETEHAKVFHGSNLDVLPTLADNSIDAIVTDPPYELGFMGKSWDSSGIAYSVELWSECMRVLKPGGHLLAFGGSRTWHRLAVAIEDAGFEMRDSIAWLYGSGFPKSMDISKAIDKNNGREINECYALGRHIRERREALSLSRAQVNSWFGYKAGIQHWEAQEQNNAQPPTQTDYTVLKQKLGLSAEFDEYVARIEAEREVIGQRDVPVGHAFAGELYGGDSSNKTINETAPATPEAIKWQGWGTALKPAFEPVVVARKPFKGTVASNVLEWGVGGLNIDGSRIATDEVITNHSRSADAAVSKGKFGDSAAQETHQTAGQQLGRWPANIILDPYTAELLDEQSGDRPGGTFPAKRGQSVNTSFASGQETIGGQRSMGDSGGASRFFYVAKASKRDRNEGLDHLEVKRPDERTEAGMGSFAEKGVQPGRNFHPTVKPTSLMRYLIKLVTPPNGTVLDPFTGSGSTGKAAILEGFNFVGIELTEDYLPIIKGRLEHAEATLNADATEQEQEQKETLF